jgi:hypothetical protein
MEIFGSVPPIQEPRWGALARGITSGGRTKVDAAVMLEKYLVLAGVPREGIWHSTNHAKT